jgi:hypothetical protein
MARIPRWATVLAALLLLAIVAVAVRPIRHAVLTAVGRALVLSHPMKQGDAVVLMSGVGPAGELEVADLMNAGMAPVALVMTPPPREIDFEFARRGVMLEREGHLARRRLTALGVDESRIQLLEAHEGGPRGQTGVLTRWCAEHRARSLIVVTAAHHTRRVGRTLGRSTRKLGVAIAMRPPRHDSFTPYGWWSSRDGLRGALVEMQKLALDYVRRPF